MSYPKNPSTIVIQNKYYPKGLKEIDIWNYYQKEKPRILNQTRGRDLMFFIATELNKFVIRRHAQKNNFIRLDKSNYDNIITGRTISIHCGMKTYEDICVIDIDSDNLDKAKEATLDVYNIMSNAPFIKTIQIRFSGKTSFHIYCTIDRKMKIDLIKQIVKDLLIEGKIQNKYTIQSKRSKGIPNIDLAPLKYKGNFICLNSLSIIGLRCMEIPLERVQRFDPHYATLKI